MRRVAAAGRLLCALALCALALAACGGGHPTAVRSRPAASGRAASGRAASGPAGSGPAAEPACASGDLAARQVPVSEGAGQYYLAWSLTNTTSAVCSLPGGRPTLRLVGASGEQVIRYRSRALPGGSSAAQLSLAPGHSAWFLTEESDPTCSGRRLAGGGPFRYEVELPAGGGAVDWRPPYLDRATLADYCPTVPLAVSALGLTRPTA